MSSNQDQYERAGVGSERYSQDTALPTLAELEGMDVRDAYGDRVGTVGDVYVDRDSPLLRYIGVKRGMLGTAIHMIPVDDVSIGRDGEDRFLALPYSREQLDGAPTHDRDEEFTREREEATYGHYGRAGYWDAVRARQTPPAPTPQIAEAEVQAAIDRGDDPQVVAVKRWGV